MKILFCAVGSIACAHSSYKKVLAVADRVRPYFMGDFYPLSDPRDDSGLPAPSWYRGEDRDECRWCAYQMHRPDLDAGFVICFRRLDTPSYVFKATLGGITPSARYSVETYGGGTCEIDGRSLADFMADLRSPRSFKLVFYSRTR